MKALILALLLCAVPAFADNQSKSTYQQGVLQGFRREQSARHCSEVPSAPGSPIATKSGACAQEDGVVYTVESEGATYLFTPRGDIDESKCGLLTRATIPHSVLADQPPLTPIQIRSDGRHVFVRIGSRESEYSVARVQ